MRSGSGQAKHVSFFSAAPPGGSFHVHRCFLCLLQSRTANPNQICTQDGQRSHQCVHRLAAGLRRWCAELCLCFGQLVALCGALKQSLCMPVATETARKRYETIKDAFQERFGAAPEAYTRSPGALGRPMDFELGDQRRSAVGTTARHCQLPPGRPPPLAASARPTALPRRKPCRALVQGA